MIKSCDKQSNAFERSVNSTPKVFRLSTDDFHFSNIANKQSCAPKPLQSSTPDSAHSHLHSPHSHSHSSHSHPDSPHSHSHSSHSHPDSPHSHLYSPHSYPGLLRSHHSPHSAPRFPISAFTDSLYNLYCLTIRNYHKILKRFQKLPIS